MVSSFFVTLSVYHSSQLDVTGTKETMREVLILPEFVTIFSSFMLILKYFSSLSAAVKQCGRELFDFLQ